MPDSISSGGVLNAPPERITSRAASARTTSPAAADVFDAGCARALHQHARRMRAGLHREIRRRLRAGLR